MSENKFVFVVCGGREHIDTLHFSLRYLRHFSKNEIVVVTDPARNAIPVEHDKVVEVKTPEHFNHHQASIYLKTGLNKFLPKGFSYCYLDTDVVALGPDCDDVFSQKHGPVTFAADHCRMPAFSLSAVRCSCVEENNKRLAEIEALKEKYDPARKWRDPVMEEKKAVLLQKFETMKEDRLNYLLITLRFMAARKKFKLDNDTFFDKHQQVWHDKNGAVIITHAESMIADIEKNSSWRWNEEKQRWFDCEGHDVYRLTCPHLAEYIANRFAIEVKDKDFQHWNGGVFLFDDTSEDFLNTWFDKTMQIFTWPEWKVRDQGTLIATVWQFGLQNNPLLPQKFNFIADWNSIDIMMNDEGDFTDDAFKTRLRPALIHIYHNFGRRGWKIWDYVSALLPGDNTALENSLCMGSEVRMGENNMVNSLWLGNDLSPLELLTLHSFVRNGHTFRLWVYEPLKTAVPPGVMIGDANEIIPKLALFKVLTANNGQISDLSGGYELFKYKLLYEKGGWWADMDVTCLQPFNTADPYFFRSHHDQALAGNVMKCPANSELMRLCYEESMIRGEEGIADPYSAIKILNKHVQGLALQSFVHSGNGNPDVWSTVERFIYGNATPRESYMFIHWMSEEWGRHNVSKYDIPHRSALGKLLQQYNLQQQPGGKWDTYKNDLRFIVRSPKLYSSFFRKQPQMSK